MQEHKRFSQEVVDEAKAIAETISDLNTRIMKLSNAISNEVYCDSSLVYTFADSQRLVIDIGLDEMFAKRIANSLELRKE